MGDSVGRRLPSVLRRRLVDDALSALNWLSGKREPVCNQMQDACVAREALSKVLRGSRRLWQCRRIFHTSLPQSSEAVVASRCHGGQQFALDVARPRGALPEGA